MYFWCDGYAGRIMGVLGLSGSLERDCLGFGLEELCSHLAEVQ